MSSTIEFDRDSMAAWYARQHLNTDPGIKEIWYLPTDAGAREIRLVEINELLADGNDLGMEPIDFGVDTGTESAHRLFVLDVTPEQWERIRSGTLSLPRVWKLEGARQFR